MTIAIITVLLTVAVPSFTTMAKDIELERARSDIFAALTAARTRAVRDRTMVALHVFRDSAPVYQSFFRWGHTWDPTALAWSDPTHPHIPTNKMTMRLEVARWSDPATNAVEFVWPNDHDPIVLPDSIGICQPGSDPAYTTYTVDVSNEFVPPASPAAMLPFYQDFYIVFSQDGKLATVLVDYNCQYDTTGANNNLVTDQVFDSGGNPVGSTYSAGGLCIYDTKKFKSLSASPAAQQAYVNRSDNLLMISPYTGLPLSMEANQ